MIIKPGTFQKISFLIYLGPKEVDQFPLRIRSFDKLYFHNIVEYGWIVGPSIKFLKKFYAFLANWGLVLICAAFGIHIALYIILYPLFYGSKYKIWPLWLQTPIYFAFFYTFKYAIEFRFAPFLFYNNLSARDPYFLLPLVAAALLFAIYFIGPKCSSKKQALVFIGLTFLSLLFAFLPVGLMLFILTNLILSLIVNLIWKSEQKKRLQKTD